MKVMVTYKVKADAVEESERLVRDVYAAFREIGDEGIHYATFRLPDGQTFVHVAMFDSPESQRACGGEPGLRGVPT